MKFGATFFFLFLLLTPSLAQDKTPVPITKIFYHFDTHLIGSFMERNGKYHITAAAGTLALVGSGADWDWYKFSAENPIISNAGFVSVSLGGFIPVALPIGMYLYGRSESDRSLQLAALAMGQAALISVAISSTYKAFTGRRPPEHHGGKPGAIDYSDDFKFGLFNRGIYNGWPSSHTMTAFAMATTLTELYPDDERLRTYAWIYASVVGIGVSTNIHWLSDAVAGALIGYSVGKTVGAGFRILDSKSRGEHAFDFYFIPNGIGLTYRF